MRILVVDDDESDRLAVRRCLLQAGIAASLEETASAGEVLDRVRSEQYDLVLLDYYLPGVDTAALLRNIQNVSDIPVVIFTGRGDEEIAVEFMKSGAADYLPKSSLTPERLATSCRYAIEMGRAAQERRRVEQSLREREAEFRTLVNAIPQMTWIADSEGRRYWFNDRWYEFTGLRPDQSLGLGWRLVHHPEHRTRVWEGQLAAFARGESWEDTFPLKRRDGVYRWFLALAVPIHREDGTVERWFGTHTDITERLETERALASSVALEQAARVEAERATRVRDEVLAVLAHDLRNPMHTILAAASMLAITPEEDKRQRQLEMIRRATGEMERLTADLLDVALIESGRFALREEAVDLRAFVQEAVSRFESQANARQTELDFHVDDDVPRVRVDRDRLLQVLSNLLSNALKFTPAGGRVSVRVAVLDGGVQISVKDSGTGIPAEDLPHVFDRFWQASRASRGGAGLGLAICKGIVEAHGGRIWAASAVGKGTTVHFTLPQQVDSAAL